MKRLLSVLIVLGAVGSFAYGADPLYVSPDVPTTTTSGANLLPNQIFRYDAAGPLWTLQHNVPGSPPPNVDALHKMDAFGDWLFSIEAPNDLAGALANPAEPGDVILYDSSTGIYSICFSAASVGLGPETNVDGVYMIGGDKGVLFVSVDVHTDIGAFTGPNAIEPADIARFQPAGPGLCPGWIFAGLAYDASTAGTGIPNSSNVGGADDVGNTTILTLDVPTDLAPPGPITYVPGQVVGSNALGFTLFEQLVGWPISSEVDGVSCLGNPGRIPLTMMIAKNGANLDLSWQASCAEGGEDYGIYEGTIGTWYGHNAIDCTDGGLPLIETIVPAGGNTYYLVVPHSLGKEEGDYGPDFDFPSSTSSPRPVGGARCSPVLNLAPCP